MSGSFRMPLLRRSGAAGVAGWVVVLGVVTLSGEVLDDYALTVCTSVLIYVILGLGINIVVGHAGLLDLGYAAFYAIGAYVSGLLMLDLGWSFWATLPVAVVAAGLAGAVIGYPTLRLRSDYLAIVTLGFGEITRIIATNLDVTGGPNGLTGIRPVTIGGQEIVSPRSVLHLVLVVLAVVLVVSALISRSRLAYAWRALRSDERAAEAAGIPTRRAKLLAYVIGGAVGSVAGPLSAVQLGTVDPSSFTFLTSLFVLLVVIIGGQGSRIGVLLGATIVVGLPELLRVVEDERGLVFALLMIVIMMVRPRGLWPARWRRLEVPAEAHSDATVPARDRRSGPVLEVHGLTRRFGGVTAVVDFALRVDAGEVVGVIGPNGAGKTTAFDCIAGRIRPLHGRVILDGRRVRGLAPHHIASAGMGRTFQSSRLFDEMTVAENVLVGAFAGARLLGGVTDADLATVRRCLDVVGLGDAHDRRAADLPAGHRRRLEIARALAGRPRIVLLDEPGAGANPTEKQQLIALIRRIRDQGIGVVLIEHDVAMVTAVSQRVVVLHHGVTIAEGSPAEVLGDPRVVEAYLGVSEDSEACVLPGAAR